MELLVTDAGSAFKAADFRTACADLGIRQEIAIAGVPQLRARIERLFRTLNLSLMPRLSGRSFENSLARGDYDGLAETALNVDDLTRALTRWVVDVYHNTPHEGLAGRTPLDAWEQAMLDWGVTPPPGPELQAQIFARPMQRNLEGDGITVIGVRYHKRARISDNGIRPRVQSFPQSAQNLPFRSEASTRVGLLDDACLSVSIVDGLRTAVGEKMPRSAGGSCRAGPSDNRECCLTQPIGVSIISRSLKLYRHAFISKGPPCGRALTSMPSRFGQVLLLSTRPGLVGSSATAASGRLPPGTAGLFSFEAWSGTSGCRSVFAASRA